MLSSEISIGWSPAGDLARQWPDRARLFLERPFLFLSIIGLIVLDRQNNSKSATLS